MGKENSSQGSPSNPPKETGSNKSGQTGGGITKETLIKASGEIAKGK